MVSSRGIRARRVLHDVMSKKPKGDGPKRKGSPLAQFRVPSSYLDEADRLAALAKVPLVTVTRSDVLRRAVELGLAALAVEIEGSKT